VLLPFGLARSHCRLRHVVPLPAELGDPEVVDHVRGRQPDLDRTVHGQVELVGRGHPELGVPELPPPLMPDGLHHQRLALGRLVGVEDGPDRRDQDEDYDDRRSERPADLRQVVAVDLARLGTGTAAVADQDVDERDLDDDEDEHRPPEDPGEQPVDSCAEVGDRFEDRLWIVLRGAADPHGREGGQCDGPERLAPFRGHSLLADPTHAPGLTGRHFIPRAPPGQVLAWFATLARAHQAVRAIQSAAPTTRCRIRIPAGSRMWMSPAATTTCATTRARLQRAPLRMGAGAPRRTAAIAAPITWKKRRYASNLCVQWMWTNDPPSGRSFPLQSGKP